MVGAKHLVEDNVCGGCGQERLASQCYHSLCCAGSEKTIGHNRLRDCVAEAFHMADAGTAIEVPGLLPRAPTLRPADVLRSYSCCTPDFHCEQTACIRDSPGSRYTQSKRLHSNTPAVTRGYLAHYYPVILLVILLGSTGYKP